MLHNSHGKVLTSFDRRTRFSDAPGALRDAFADTPACPLMGATVLVVNGTVAVVPFPKLSTSDGPGRGFVHQVGANPPRSGGVITGRRRRGNISTCSPIPNKALLATPGIVEPNETFGSGRRRRFVFVAARSCISCCLGIVRTGCVWVTLPKIVKTTTHLAPEV